MTVSRSRYFGKKFQFNIMDHGQSFDFVFNGVHGYILPSLATKIENVKEISQLHTNI